MFIGDKFEKFKIAIRLILFGLFIFDAGTAYASPADDDAQLRRDRQIAQERQTRQQTQDVFLQEKTVKLEEHTLPVETPSFWIKKITLEGADVKRFPWLQKEADFYQNHSIGKQGIDKIVKQLGNLLIEHGYITSRVLVPEQDVASGSLKLQVVTGYIGEIRFAEPVEHASWKTAFPCKPGDILNLRDLEQGLEQMKRVPSQDVDFKLVPGKEPGTSDIVITMKRGKADKMILSLDDSGNRATGRLQGSYTYSVDNLLGKNDLFNLSFNKDADGDEGEKGTDGHSVYWSLPDGYWTYSFSYRDSSYKQTIPMFGAGICFRGESHGGDIKIERLIHRDQSSKTSVNIDLKMDNGHNYLNGAEIANQFKQTTSLQLGIAQRRYIKKSVVDYQISYRHGVPWFHAQDDQELSNNTYTSQYGIWTGEIDYTSPLTMGNIAATYTGTLHGQYTNSALYGGECISIGNRYTVRGFDGEETLMGDSGWYWRNEISVPLDAKGHQIYYALDYGQVSGERADSLSGKDLLGAALGLRGNLGQVQADVFVGWALKKPDEIKSSGPTMGFQCYVQF